MSNPLSQQSILNVNYRQRELQLQNSRLKNEVKSSHQFIRKLQSDIQELKKHNDLLKQQNSNLKNYQNNNISVNNSNNSNNNNNLVNNNPVNNKNNISISNNIPLSNNQQPLPTSFDPPSLRRSPTSKSTLKLSKDFRQQLEVFTSSSESDNMDEYQQQDQPFQSISTLIHPLGKSNKNVYFEDSSIILGNRNNNNEFNNQRSEIKLNSSKKLTPKSLKKIDSTKLFRPLSYFDVDPNDQDSSTFSTIKSQLSPLSSALTRSQKLIPNQQSIIKTQGRIKDVISPQKVFKKVLIGKPIYDVFFVTGISAKGAPQVIYSYPKEGSEHFQAILSICYSDEVLRMKQANNMNSLSSNISNSSKNLLNNTSIQNGASHKLKQFYVIPLRKLNADTQNEREYLTVCEVQQIVMVPKDNMLLPCTFQRMYCFISSQQFFIAYKNLVNQFLDKINHNKMQNVNNRPYNSEQQYKVTLRECLQQPLSTLAQKSAESNHTLSYKLDQFVSISIDIPSMDNSYKLVGQFRPWGVMNFKMQVKPAEQYINPLQMKLFGLLITYVLSEKKVVLYSAFKSKVSEAILHLLEIIKPLQYVCPVIMTSLKQQHEEYFSAPMSLILGLWTQQRRLQKQKIQIFMNRRQNLTGQIQKGKTHIQNGIVINLDTGLVFGDGLNQSLTTIASVVNQYYENYCHHLKDVFKMFQRLFNGKDLNRDEVELIQIKHKFDLILKDTQLWTYFTQRNFRKPKFLG